MQDFFEDDFPFLVKRGEGDLRNTVLLWGSHPLDQVSLDLFIPKVTIIPFFLHVHASLFSFLLPSCLLRLWLRPPA